MKKNCQWTSVLTAALLVSVSLILMGCGGGKEESSGSTPAPAPLKEGQLSWQQDTSPFTFDLYFYGAWGADGYPWRGALVEQYITEDTGVTPNIICPVGNEKEYLNVMIASNDLPDAMVLEWYQPETKKLIEAGSIYSINELSEKYAPELMGMISDDVISYHSQEDGKLYYLPSFMSTNKEFEGSLEKHNARPLFIQKGIYEDLGEPSVDTPEKLIRFLKEIKQNYPDVRPFGIEPPLDINQWGLTGSYTLQYFAGIFAPETYAKDQYLDNGQVKMIFENRNYIEGVRFLNRIYREGLISVDLLIRKHETYNDIVDSGQVAVTGAFPIDIWKSHNVKIMQLTNDERKTLVPLDFMKYDGKEPQFSGNRGAGWVASMVTKKAKDPGRIIRYLEYCWGDQGQLTNLFGREGETYRMVDGKPQYLPEVLQEIQTDNSALKNKYGFEQRLVMWRSKWTGLQKLALAPPAYADYLNSVARYGVDVWNLGLDGLDPDPSSREGVAYARIKNIWNKFLSKMVLAENEADFDAAYEEGMDEIRGAGLEQVKALMMQKHLEDIAKKQGQ